MCTPIEYANQVSCYRAEYAVSLKAHAWTKGDTYEWHGPCKSQIFIYLFIYS
jgi:hypothetical protein